MEQNQPRASIIIIAYNAEKTIERAIQSAREQSEKNIEIICVDDGSTDSTYERMCQYAEQDERIKPVTQANSGILGARYSGLQQVTSDYVLLLDSDDTLIPEAVETACDAADEIGADVLEFGVETVANPYNPPPEGAMDTYNQYFSQERPLPETARGVTLINACFEEHIIKWNLWNKLYRTELLREAVQYYRGEWLCIAEDQLIILLVLFSAKRYARITTKLYVYTIGGGMTTMGERFTDSTAIKRWGTQWLALTLARNWLEKRGCTQEEITVATAAFARYIRETVVSGFLDRCAPDRRAEFFDWLSQSCTREEFVDFLFECVERQQTLLEQSAQENRQLSESVEQARAQVEKLEMQNYALRESFDTISNAFFWKITKPVRALLDCVKAFFVK